MKTTTNKPFMQSEIKLEDIIKKFPGVFSNPSNRRKLFKSRNKNYIIEECKLRNKEAYQVIEVKEGVKLKLGKHFSSIEEVEATYATEINF